MRPVKASLPPLPRKKTEEDVAWANAETVDKNVDKPIKKSRTSSTLVEPIDDVNKEYRTIIYTSDLESGIYLYQTLLTQRMVVGQCNEKEMQLFAPKLYLWKVSLKIFAKLTQRRCDWKVCQN